ncbi:uncharacterized protein LOC130736352 [Lotus japonicus]|uniref:uncharacterized protein LOC130736352 n=1 Tax=Lotus japonicus TaxID=34305 RepID=UPI0025884289|nr:uncharacterized protein LOC130736352 [Lotus japonicus]
MWRVGHGKSIKAWEDKWIPSSGPMVFRNEVAWELNITQVLDLLEENGGRWKRNMVELLCWPPTATTILSIPLPMQPREDCFFWLETINGCYSVKTGYYFIRKKQMEENASTSSTPSLSHAQWTKLWKAEVVPRCRETVWRACLGLLPVKDVLHCRGVVQDPCCPCCPGVPETIHHALFFCPIAKLVLFGSPLAIRVDVECSVQQFLSHFLAAANLEVAGILFTLFYALWQVHNELVYNGREAIVAQVLQRAVALPPSLVLQQDAPPAGRNLQSSWRKPVAGLFKVNFDASMKDSHDAGLGFIARNSHGEVLAAATMVTGPVQNPVLAEALAFRWALGLAAELGLQRVWFESDFLALVQAWERHDSGFSHLYTVVRDCRLLLSNFDAFEFSFVRRTGNCAADALARLAFHFGCIVWIEEDPLEVSSIIQDDVIASMASS